LGKYKFTQRRNRLTTHFSERISVVKRRMAVIFDGCLFLHDYSIIYVVSSDVTVLLLLDLKSWCGIIR